MEKEELKKLVSVIRFLLEQEKKRVYEEEKELEYRKKRDEELSKMLKESEEELKQQWDNLHNFIIVLNKNN